MKFRRSATGDGNENTATTTATANGSATGSAAAEAPQRPEDERLAPQLLFTYGLQHILTMYAGAIAPALIIGAAADVTAVQQGILISGALLVAGIATLIQSVGHCTVGAQLPIVVACSFVPVSAAATIAANQGLPVVFGASLAAGIFALLLTPFFGQLIRFFPPVVTGTIIAVIGLSLMPVAADWIIDSDGSDTAPLGNLALAGITLALVLLFSRVLPGLLGRISILLGIVAGTLIAVPFGHTNFSTVGEGAIFSLGEPLHFGPPEFEIAAIITMCIIMLVVLTEGASHIIAVGEITGSKIDARRISAGLRADVSLSIIGPIFNATPGSSFAQNIGLLALTKIKSRYVVAVGGLILIGLGLFPILGRIVSEIPMPVLGGAGLVLFGTVAASGIRTLGKVDFSDNLNVILVATAFGFGLIPLAVPDFYEAFPEAVALVLHSGIVGAAVVAVVLNICFNIIGRGEYAESPSVFASAPTLDKDYPPDEADGTDGTGGTENPDKPNNPDRPNADYESTASRGE